jgi:hypothetical protein
MINKRGVKKKSHLKHWNDIETLIAYLKRCLISARLSGEWHDIDYIKRVLRDKTDYWIYTIDASHIYTTIRRYGFKMNYDDVKYAIKMWHKIKLERAATRNGQVCDKRLFPLTAIQYDEFANYVWSKRGRPTRKEHEYLNICGAKWKKTDVKYRRGMFLDRLYYKVDFDLKSEKLEISGLRGENIELCQDKVLKRKQ